MTDPSPVTSSRQHLAPGLGGWPASFVLLALACLVGGMWAGLVRMGWPLQVTVPDLLHAHGPLMVAGFVGTMMGIERAVVLRAGWVLVGALLTAVSSLALIWTSTTFEAGFGVALGSGVFVVAALFVFLRQRAIFTATMLVAALCWLAGNVLWLSPKPVFEMVHWWMAFLVLTIAAERLELTRLTSRGRGPLLAFVTIAGAIVAGALAAVFHDLVVGTTIFGLALVAMAVWLGRFDIARENVDQEGLPRYVAWCLLSGYLWLAAGGLMLAYFGQLIFGPRYDAALHAVFVGFVLSVIFGHGPIILPALAPLTVRYSKHLYAGLVLLHGSLLLRIVGDLGLGPRAREIGGLLNVAAILIFIVTMMSLTRRRRRAAS